MKSLSGDVSQHDFTIVAALHGIAFALREVREYPHPPLDWFGNAQNAFDNHMVKDGRQHISKPFDNGGGDAVASVRAPGGGGGEYAGQLGQGWHDQDLSRDAHEGILGGVGTG